MTLGLIFLLIAGVIVLYFDTVYKNQSLKVKHVVGYITYAFSMFLLCLVLIPLRYTPQLSMVEVSVMKNNKTNKYTVDENKISLRGDKVIINTDKGDIVTTSDKIEIDMKD